MARTTKTDVYNPDILRDTIQGQFAQKEAFTSSRLRSSGAVVLNDSFHVNQQKMIGTRIVIPRFGVLGEFVSNPDGSAVDFSAIGQDVEYSTVGRDSLGFEVSTWAEFINTLDPGADAYKEAARQAMISAGRAMDKCLIDEAATTPLVLDMHSLTTPVYMDYSLMAEGKATFWGDDQEEIVAAIVHSRTKVDMLNLKDTNGNPLLVPSQKDGDFDRFCGVPLVVSDRAPLTGSTMGTVVESGTTPPDVTLSGTPLGPWNLEIDINGAGASGTATFRFRVKGALWSKTFVVPAAGGSIVLDDSKNAITAPADGIRKADSLVGINGKTGITATFTNGTYAADNLYQSTARLKVTSQLVKKGALAFWYNKAAMGLNEDKDIARHTNLGAIHLYRTAHLWERVANGNMPGVVSIQHNVSNYL